VKKALLDFTPAAAFTGGLGMACYGLSLAWSPLGYIVGGALVAGGAAVYELCAAAAAARTKVKANS
jgi:hypothetical protein